MYQEEYITGHSPQWKTPEKYVEAKVKILQRDFYIKPTKEELEHLHTLKTQIAIDNAVLTIINNHWN